MKVYIGCDHNGLKLKDSLVKYLAKFGISAIDVGVTEFVSDDDYNTYAKLLCKKVLQDKENRGILVCGSGVGMTMQANRFKGIRAVLGDNTKTVKSARMHNDANVLCLGARQTGKITAEIRTAAFITTRFNGGHYQKRNELLDK